MVMIYLDNSATTRMDEKAAETAVRYMCEDYYNPAAAYAFAAGMEKQLNNAREVFAKSAHASSGEVIFTSGGTESNNAAVSGVLRRWKGKGRVITTAVEHPSMFDTLRILSAERGLEFVVLPVLSDGSPDLVSLENMLTEDTAFVSMMHVNNELGTVSDLKTAGQFVHKLSPRAVFHADGVQGFLKCPFSLGDADMYSVSAHKFHGPKGVGALFVKSGVPFAGGQIGGGQENNLRSGTSNMPGIMSAADAVSSYMNAHEEILSGILACKKRLYDNMMKIDDVVLNGPSLDKAAPHILNLSFMGVRAAVLVNALSSLGTCASTGSACSSHKKNGNRILSAAGINGPRQEAAVRFSFGRYNTIEEIDTASGQIEEQVRFLRKYRRR